ncbi:hypothetical protein EV2_035021 [Malus domestica]
MFLDSAPASQSPSPPILRWNQRSGRDRSSFSEGHPTQNPTREVSSCYMTMKPGWVSARCRRRCRIS